MGIFCVEMRLERETPSDEDFLRAALLPGSMRRMHPNTARFKAGMSCFMRNAEMRHPETWQNGATFDKARQSGPVPE